MSSDDEYIEEILAHLVSLESDASPSLGLIQQQPEINLKMRPLLLDFLMDVINKLGFSKLTFPLTVNLIDRYCSTRIVKKQHYQLLGLTSLWICCKNHEAKTRVPSLFDLCKMCCNCYNKKLFLEMENHVLKSLSWLISFPTFDAFVDLYIELLVVRQTLAASAVPNIKAMAIYICELVQFYPNLYFNFLSSQIAMGALLMSVLICKAPANLHSVLTLLNSVVKAHCILKYDAFTTYYKSCIKIIKCPPPSLKLKYFTGGDCESDALLALMALMVSFVNEQLLGAPITPKPTRQPLLSLVPTAGPSYQQQFTVLPRTPVSTNISPRMPSEPDGAGSLSHIGKLSSFSLTDVLPSPTALADLLSADVFGLTTPTYVHPPLVYTDDKSGCSRKRARTASVDLLLSCKRRATDLVFIS